ncbi:MAG: thiolase domain-containing protein [Anaerolineaceae bacterium]|nr:thiolase domain-containing protein [Anaerolineaceae bacterium]
MREVAVIGIGQTKIDEHWDKSLRDLAGNAILAALQDARLPGVEGMFVGNMLSGPSNNQQHLGSYIADWVGLRYIEALRVEAACSSGAASFRTAVMAVASGELDSALAVGVEKMTDSPSSQITAGLATAADADWEVDHGLSFVALNALVMRRYMHEFGWEREQFAHFTLNAHANGAHNPNARFQKPITEDAYRTASMIAEPITVLDASPMGDGAAAAVIVPADFARRHSGKPAIKVLGSGAATDTMAVHSRRAPLWLRATELSVKQVYSQTGLTPKDIDLYELHDAFTIMAALSLEAAGFAEQGQAPRLALEGEIGIHGRIPIATMGGLKARGHPVGATGMYQLTEAVIQLRGDAGAVQVPGARTALCQNIGGSGSNIIAHILQTD